MSGHQRAQPLDLPVGHGRIFHRQPLIGGAGFRNQRVHAADDAADLALGPRVLQHQLAHLQRQIANRHKVFVRLGGEADHVVELQVLDAVGEDQLGAIQDLVVRDGLVDDAAEPVRAGFRRDGNAALAARPQDSHDRLGQIVEPQRGGADHVAHLEQPRQDAIDVRDGRRARSTRARRGSSGPRGLGELEDAIGRKRADGQVVVAGPAEAAEIRAPAHDFDRGSGNRTRYRA